MAFGLFLLLIAGTSLVSSHLYEATAQSNPPPNAATNDYLSNSLQLLFPAAPASLELKDVKSPIFSSDTPGYDYFSLGVLPDPARISSPVTKTITLELGGGFRGRIFARPPWLNPLPDRFINPTSAGKLQVAVTVRQDAGQGAGLLPGQTNWGHLLLSLNGVLFDYTVPLTVGNPVRVGRDNGDQVFEIYGQVTAQLDKLGDLETLISTPSYPDGGQLALGLIVDYLGENRYNQRLPSTEFVNRVCETLAQKDYNNDGWLGFKPEDILLGAPGWALGRKAK